MTRRVLFVGLALAIVVGFSLAPAEAKGRCPAVVAGTVCCLVTGTDGTGDEIEFSDRRCRTEGRVCSRAGSECATRELTIDCVQVPCGDADPDGGEPGLLQVGVGCFCGGGLIGTLPVDPVSADNFLRMLEALESEDTGDATCEAPPSLLPATAE